MPRRPRCTHHIHLIDGLIPNVAVPLCIHCDFVDWGRDFARCPLGECLEVTEAQPAPRAPAF